MYKNASLRLFSLYMNQNKISDVVDLFFCLKPLKTIWEDHLGRPSEALQKPLCQKTGVAK